MLRPKLWSGLSGSNTRNASRYKYYTIDELEIFFTKELRTWNRTWFKAVNIPIIFTQW